MDLVLRDCQSQVLLRLLILVAQLMSIKNTTILCLLGITVHLRLFLVISWLKLKVLRVLCQSVYMNGWKLISILSGLGWSYPCDIWSVGCILVELCSVCLLSLMYVS